MRPTDAMRNAKNPSESSIARVAFWDAWEAENAGKIVLSADDFALIEAMHTALMRAPEVAALFAEGETEVTLRWLDEATGLRCKASADRWHRPRRYLTGLTTTDAASKRALRPQLGRAPWREHRVQDGSS